MQFGLPNPLEEYMSQFLDTKLGSQRCYMELFNENLTKFTTFGDHNLVHYIIIAVGNKINPCMVCHTKLWITGLYHMQEMSHLTVASIMLHI